MATFVLVHGGGHGAWCWDRVAPLLQEKGHRVLVPTLSGVGERYDELRPDTGLMRHVHEIAVLITGHAAEPVILAGHSYGCMVITGAAASVPDNVAELVFCDGPHPIANETLLDASPGARGAIEPQVRTVNGVEQVLFPTEDTLAIYGIVADEDQQWALPKLTPHPWKCFTEPLHLEHPDALACIPRTAIECTASLARRDPAMAERAARSGRTFVLDTGHDLMITEPVQTVDLLLKVAENPLSR